MRIKNLSQTTIESKFGGLLFMANNDDVIRVQALSPLTSHPYVIL